MNCEAAFPELSGAGPVIREAVSADLELIARLYRQNHLSSYRGLLPDAYCDALSEEVCREKWARFLASPENRIWVAWNEGAFLGFAAASPDTELTRTCYLESLHVAEASRGRGVGTALIHCVGAFAAENGYTRMSVCIVRGNGRAARLYQRLGARHFRCFEDSFLGYPSSSEKLLWDSLPT